MEWLQELFKKYPELAVYLALGAGYWVGGRKIRGFSLGGATGSLLAGIVIGTFFKVPVAAMAKSVVFLLFMFGIGYSVGPKFFKAMKGEGWRYAVVGRYVLKANPILVLGALAGAQTFTPGLAAVQEKSGSPIAVLGYTGAVPLGHVLLTTSGTIIVLLLSHAT